MNRHQILTGAANSGDSCYSVGSVEGVHFIAYAAGCDIVILASDFQRVQIIPGATHGNIQIRCVDCSSDTGKIAASYDQQVLVFEPTPLLHHTSSHKLDYQWYQTACLKCECFVNTLSWNFEGTRLLVAGSVIQLWQSPEDSGNIHSQYDNCEDSSGHVGFHLEPDEPVESDWRSIWSCETSSPVYHLRFSPDGLLFASAGKSDRLVKVWYENKKSEMLRNENYNDEEEKLDYSFCFIAHPAPVIDFSWRRISKYMPRGTVTNVLMTWARDNICRLWSETVLPDDGLVDVQQFDLKVLQDPKLHATRHKNRFVHKLGHIRHAMHKRRKHKKEGRSQGLRITAMSTTESSHDFHKYWMQQNGLTPVLHFHLAATINPATDIPISPTLNPSHDSHFIVHWLNNKELQFTVESEKLMNDINSKTQHEETIDEYEHAELVVPEKKKKTLWNRISSHSKLSNIESDPDMEQLQTIASAASFSSLDHWSNKSQANFGIPHEESHASFAKNKDSTDKMVLDESFDRNIEKMLREWHNSPDVLFAIHPADGSLLVWSVDYLDEIEPGCFRQAQVTFSSRLPHVFPIGDAMSMSPNIMTYSTNGISELYNAEANADGAPLPVASVPDIVEVHQLPNIHILTKHLNGSLNLWKANFSENSKYRACLSLSHSSRVCGHRFRTNSAATHPVLPLLITTSHHNLQAKSQLEEFIEEEDEAKTTSGEHKERQFDPAVGLSSELILWRTDPVGPLNQAGGITELAKINSPNIAAFDHVAWLPTLLPSSALGSTVNSPSSLFVASDGYNMRLYLAVIDARGILSEGQQRNHTKTGFGELNNTVSQTDIYNGFNIVSEQSTSRPGCIVELDAIKSAQHDWTTTQLLHVYQGQLVTGKDDGLHSEGAFIDLRNLDSFTEKFYLVVMEKAADAHSYLHMWEIVISSLQNEKPESEEAVDDADADSMASDSSSEPSFDQTSGPQFKVDTRKVYSHRLLLPDGVEVLHTAVAAGHLSSSMIYPACFAPYLFTTACSDGLVRFWACKLLPDGRYYWHEWNMVGQDSSSIKVPGRPITVSCSYTGRIAVAYRMGAVMSARDNPNDKYVNLYVSIYECESTGGSEWVQEDVLELKNIFIPDIKAEIDLSCILGTERKISHVLSSENFFKMQLGSHHAAGYSHSPHAPSPGAVSPSTSLARLPHVPSIPSLSCINSVKRCIAERGNKTGILQQKHLVQLDWAPTEDGGHILTVAVGSKILFFSPVSNDIANNTELMAKTDTPSSGHPSRPVLQKTLSLSMSHSVPPTIRWLRLRSLELSTADGLPPLPMHVSWAKDGVLIVGMDNEMHVYSQWVGPQSYNDICAVNESSRRASQANLKPASTTVDLQATGKMSTLRISQSVPHLHRMLTSAKLSEKREKRELKRMNTLPKLTESLPPLLTILQECGLFEAVQITNPVLPQYHPKQLLELLNFGKVRRVKAILAHLMHCITSNMPKEEEAEAVPFRPRAMSVHTVAQSKGKIQVAEEMTSFVDISSIPPLPLYCLLAADTDSTLSTVIDRNATGVGTPGNPTGSSNKEGYDELFTGVYDPSNDDLDLRLSDSDDEEDSESPARRRRHSSAVAPRSRFMFGPKESETLSEALIHVRLPGLNNLDQMYLMALADTVANTQTDFSDRFTAEKHTSDIDDCGLRYIVSVGHHTYLMKTLAPAIRQQVKKTGLPFSDIIWGFHSETEEELLHSLPCKNEPTWEDLKLYGAGWLITNINVLRRTVENVAKTSFQKTKDPLDSAIFYLAMKKKMVVWGLYRSINDEKMKTFFKNDFTQERWRKAALKNAYALLGFQRFTHAAAFFLLAGSISSAVDVCLTKLNDIQLAIVISRLYTNDLVESGLNENVKAILVSEVLGGEKRSNATCHPDPFLRSMAYWMCKDYKLSLSTLLVRDLGCDHQAFKEYNENEKVSVFNFYNYLRTHPLLLRQKLASHADNKRMKAAALLSGFSHAGAAKESDMVVSLNEKITPTERSLFFHTAHDHFKSGCPALALEVLTKLPIMAEMDESEEEEEEEKEEEKPAEQQQVSQNAAHFDWGAPATQPASQKAADFDWGAPATQPASQKAADFDWGAPATQPASQKATDFDWGAPATQPASQKATDFDWGAPGSVKSEGTSSTLDWGSALSDPFTKLNRKQEDEPPSFSVMSSDSDSSSDDEGLVMKQFGDNKSYNSESDSDKQANKKAEPAKRPTTLLAPPTSTDTTTRSSSASPKPEMPSESTMFDIMAQQLKFIACLKIAMEELATLATGFEVEGGQLRYQLYIWLEKQVDVLKALCNYAEAMDDVENDPIRGGVLPTTGNDQDRLSDRHSYQTQSSQQDDWQNKSGQWSASSTPQMGPKANLHEVIMADRLDFEAKQQRMARRKQWLKRNQQLLRTLLTYCSLYGASGGGLACIKMELILLLQELQQERTQKQLLSPLPFPTTLPLLSASCAVSKTVTLDPITYLQSFIKEMLSTESAILAVPDYTGNLRLVVTLRNLSTALSSCIYECLCDSDSIIVSKTDDVGLEGFTNISTSVVYKDSCLMAGAKKRHHSVVSNQEEVPSSPPAKWPGVTQLIAMLMRERDADAPKLPLLLCESLFSVYMAVFIHALTFYETNVLFRLAVHTVSDKMWSVLFGGGIKTVIKQRTTSINDVSTGPTGPSDVNKARAKLFGKLRVVQSGANTSPAPARPANKPVYHEKFIPPKMSMVNYLFSKPHMSSIPYGIDYDSDDPDEEDAFEAPEREEDEEADDDEEEASSQNNDEHMDPHSYSWTLMRLAMVKHVSHTMHSFLSLIGFEPADLPSSSPLLHQLLKTLESWERQLVSMMDKFISGNQVINSIDLIPGLLVNHHVSGPSINKYKSMLDPDNTPFRSNQHAALPCRRLWFYLVHQEHLQDVFIRYLFGKKKKSFSSGTDVPDSAKFGVKIIHKDPEVVSAFCLNSSQETSIALATHKEILELDIASLLHPPSWADSDSDEEDGKNGEFIYVPDSRKDLSTAALGSSLSNTSQTGRGTTVTMRHQLQDIKKMSCHPIFPYYLAGGNDGAIKIFEFGHHQQIQDPRQAGSASRPSRLQFNAQGNKFGVTDSEGFLSLYQVGFGTNVTTSYLHMPCHNKFTSDFAFISSSSLLATSGYSSDGSNVGMWDTLLPQRCSHIQSFHCHEYGSTALLYAPQHQLLVSGGKKGDVCIFDVRQRKLLHSFTVHDSSVKCLALDPCEEFFVTGSSEGDIKVWGLSMHQLIRTYPAEHSKTSMFSRIPNSGVLQLHVTNDGYLYSAGADGTLKVRLISDEHGSVAASTAAHAVPVTPETVTASKSVTFSL